ncbi:MAG: helix-turn-helix domain-containing protein [Rhodothermales bacterium]
MPLEPEHGHRFAQDMRRIREARNLSVADVNEETKIPRGLIEAFEDRALFDHPQFNRVYLRSFVRTYAQVIAIDADVALDALEEALSARYAGSLAVEYLDEEPDLPVSGASEAEGGHGSDAAADGEQDAATHDDASEAESDGPTVEKDEGDGERKSGRPASEAQAKGSKKKAARSKDASADTPSAKEAGGEMPPDPESSREPKRSFVSTTQATAAGFQKTAAEKEEAGESGEGERDDRPAPSVGSGKRKGRSAWTLRRETPSMRRVMVGAAVVIVMAVLVWMLSSVIGGSDDAVPQQAGADTESVDPAESPGDAPGDAAGSQGVPAPSSSVPAVIPPLGDSMSVRIVASYGRVDPIRVTVDDDLRRPYWIPLGDSMTFYPAEQIVIESLLDSVDVKLEGIPYPKNRVDREGRIVITRDTALDYFSSLRDDQ